MQQMHMQRACHSIQHTKAGLRFICQYLVSGLGQLHHARPQFTFMCKHLVWLMQALYRANGDQLLL